MAHKDGQNFDVYGQLSEAICSGLGQMDDKFVRVIIRTTLRTMDLYLWKYNDAINSKHFLKLRALGDDQIRSIAANCKAQAEKYRKELEGL